MASQGPTVKYTFTQSTETIDPNPGQLVAFLDKSGFYYDVEYNGVEKRYPITQVQFVTEDVSTGQEGFLYVNTVAKTIGIWDGTNLVTMSGPKWKPIA